MMESPGGGVPGTRGFRVMGWGGATQFDCFARRMCRAYGARHHIRPSPSADALGYLLTAPTGAVLFEVVRCILNRLRFLVLCNHRMSRTLWRLLCDMSHKIEFTERGKSMTPYSL